jgi:2-iminobutanoate/2-iminopropanoate deaminase
MPSPSLARLLPLAVAVLAGSACTAAPEASAVVPPAPPEVAFLNEGALHPELPFSEAVRIGNLVQLSGQIGAKGGELTVVPGGIEAETRQTMENIRGTLERNGLSLDDVVKCTVMLADMSEWPAFNEIYRSYFTAPYPARSALGANGLALGARVEVECLAADGAAAARRDSPSRSPVSN